MHAKVPSPNSNGSPEHNYFERAVRLENEKADLVTDLKALWEEVARDPDMNKESVKVLKRAVKVHIEDPERRAARKQLELDAEELLARLGQLGDTPLGQAARDSLHGASISD